MFLLKLSHRFLAVLLAALLLLPATLQAKTVLVAVAANFAAVAAKLKPVFEAKTGFDEKIIIGSTGKLYAQISNGAPFDVMLAADQRRPRLLEKSGMAVAGSRFTYALGRLTLWSPDASLIGTDGANELRHGTFRFLAIANPGVAPYGLAAKQALTKLGLWKSLRPRIVMGQNIAQTFAMVATGNAELGLVAKSYAISPNNAQPGSSWNVPQALYKPIRQDAVLLTRGRNNAAAKAFLAFLKSDAAKAVMRTYGYGLM